MTNQSNLQTQKSSDCLLQCHSSCNKCRVIDTQAESSDSIKVMLEETDPAAIKWISFIHGDAYQRRSELAQYVKYAKKLGFDTHIITNALFGLFPSRVSSAMATFKISGLDKISISWNDNHNGIFPFDCVANVYNEGKKSNIPVTFYDQ